jgi:starch synthase
MESFLGEGVCATKLHLLPYGVRVEHFAAVSRPPTDLFRILFVGSLSIRKGVRYLFEAFRDFPHPHKELVIAGTIAEEVRPLVAAFDHPNVKYLGHVPNAALSALYSTSHVFALPSVEEGLAMVMAEALACGCPVIASTNTGAADLFGDGKEGFIVPARNSAAIRDCFVRLADEAGLRERMSAAAVERIHGRGGWSAYGDRYVEVLGRAVGSRRTV